MSEPRVLSQTRAADYICRSVREIKRLVETDPTFPRSFTLRPGGDPVYDRRDLDAWVDARKHADDALSAAG